MSDSWENLDDARIPEDSVSTEAIARTHCRLARAWLAQGEIDRASSEWDRAYSYAIAMRRGWNIPSLCTCLLKLSSSLQKSAQESQLMRQLVAQSESFGKFADAKGGSYTCEFSEAYVRFILMEREDLARQLLEGYLQTIDKSPSDLTHPKISSTAQSKFLLREWLDWLHRFPQAQKAVSDADMEKITRRLEEMESVS